MQITHRITIEPASRGERGQRYRATYDGAVLIESSRNPEFDACRALMAQGVSGLAEIWWRGGSFPAMTLDIAGAAELTVSETDKEGPRLIRWRPFVAVDARNSVLPARRRGVPPVERRHAVPA
jgi:hypothetical protein